MIGRAFILLGAILALSASAFSSAPAWAQSSVQQESSDTIDGFPFPDAISGHARGQMQRFPGPGGFGFSVRYKSQSGWADIYVYDREKDLSSARPSDLAEELATVLREIQTMSEIGRIKNLAVKKVTTNAKTASAATSYTVNSINLASFAFVTVAGGKFVKIRYSTPQQKEAEKTATKFRDDYFSRLKSLPQPKQRGDQQSI
ncbi:hypothetical protein [Microvirga terricola]|uniref:Secreted protein n=1 Tax=Microvirga terricola TaxID=2719797 RepID=A0ABX0VBZ6_9HYPH|nr:hypothetical protein [Microvirga terricola]NIX77218.1 hypothetical protein [Microvirga terricola]